MTEEPISADMLSELIEKRKYSDLRRCLTEMKPADLAELRDEMNKEEYTVLFRLLPKQTAAEVFVEMDSDIQEQLINSFSDAELQSILSELYYDDTADIVDEMPANVVSRLLRNASPDMRKNVNELLRYPDSTAGSIMTTEYVSLKQDMSVAQALDYIRAVGIDRETVYTCYVTDGNRHLIGLVTAQSLLISPTDRIISGLMETHVISCSTHDDREEVARTLEKYDFLALPVVDAENRLVGIVTLDDAIDVINEETEEDFAKMAAITPTEKTYLKTSVFEIWKSRIPWLLLLMISATFTGMIITSFETALAAQAALTAFIPMLMDTGGNSGSQSSVTVIRGLSLGDIEFPDLLKVLWKECRVAFFCGITLSAVTFVKIQLVDNLLMKAEVSVPVAAVVCLTLCVTVFCAKLIGCSLPILAKKVGFDPAVMASPFITTIVDAVSLLVYFALASAMLGL